MLKDHNMMKAKLIRLNIGIKISEEIISKIRFSDIWTTADNEGDKYPKLDIS